MRESTVLMYSRRRCGLCDEARGAIEEVRARLPRAFRLEEVFIDGDDVLEAAYGLSVPVVLVDGAIAFEYRVDPEVLARMVS